MSEKLKKDMRAIKEYGNPKRKYNPPKQVIDLDYVIGMYLLENEVSEGVHEILELCKAQLEAEKAKVKDYEGLLKKTIRRLAHGRDNVVKVFDMEELEDGIDEIKEALEKHKQQESVTNRHFKQESGE